MSLRAAVEPVGVVVREIGQGDPVQRAGLAARRQLQRGIHRVKQAALEGTLRTLRRRATVRN